MRFDENCCVLDLGKKILASINVSEHRAKATGGRLTTNLFSISLKSLNVKICSLLQHT